MADQATTKVSVDLSLFTRDNSFGHINGEMLFPFVPAVGEVISFNHPESDGEDELIGVVRVDSIHHLTGTPSLMLSDLYIDTKEDAIRVSRFLERSFGLFANIHDEDDLRAYIDQERNRDS